MLRLFVKIQFVDQPARASVRFLRQRPRTEASALRLINYPANNRRSIDTDGGSACDSQRAKERPLNWRTGRSRLFRSRLYESSLILPAGHSRVADSDLVVVVAEAEMDPAVATMAVS